MKQFYIFIIVFLSFGLTACNNDDNDDQIIDNSLFAGEWCMVDESGEINEMTLSSSHSVEGNLYYAEEGITTLQESFSGSWIFYPANNILTMQIYHPSTMISSTTSYKVEKLDNYTMQIRNQELGNLEAYYRLTSTKTMSVGSQVDISNVGVSSANKFYSSNTDIITVDNNGTVTALKAGTAYVLIALDKKAAFVKIKVESRSDVFGREVCMKVSDILDIHGTPDFMGEWNGNYIIAYIASNKDTDLQGVQYYYSEDSQEIHKILLGYKSEDVFGEDLALIKSQYIYYGQNQYGLWQERVSNDYTIIVNENSFYINYMNTAYYYQQSNPNF